MLNEGVMGKDGFVCPWDISSSGSIFIICPIKFYQSRFFYLLSFTVEWFSNFLYFSKMSLFRTLCC